MELYEDHGYENWTNNITGKSLQLLHSNIVYPKFRIWVLYKTVQSGEIKLNEISTSKMTVLPLQSNIMEPQEELIKYTGLIQMAGHLKWDY